MIYRLQQIDLDTMKVILYVYMHYNIYLYLLYIYKRQSYYVTKEERVIVTLLTELDDVGYILVSKIRKPGVTRGN